MTDSARSSAPIAVVGAAGQLGSELVATLRGRGVDVVPLTRSDIDLDRPEAMDVIAAIRPRVVVNAAAWTDVDGCARDPKRAMRINGRAAGAIAGAASTVGALVVQVSTNEVFDGVADRPYVETDRTNPINPYGASKLAGEAAVAAANPRYLIVRTAWLFGRSRDTFPGKIRAAAHRALAAGKPLRVVDDEHGNPTWVPDLAAGIVQAIALAQRGNTPRILHIAGWPPASRLEWAWKILDDLQELRILAIRQADFDRPSSAPERAVLDVGLARSLGIEPPDWQTATASLLKTPSAR